MMTTVVYFDRKWSPSQTGSKLKIKKISLVLDIQYATTYNITFETETFYLGQKVTKAGPVNSFLSGQSPQCKGVGHRVFT